MTKKKSTSKKTTKETRANTAAKGESSEPKQGRKKTRPATTSYSTRFDEAQRDLIEQAARIKQWSPAQLIREAVIRCAADVVNAAPPSQEALRMLATKVVDHFYNPKGTAECVMEWVEDTARIERVSFSAEETFYSAEGYDMMEECSVKCDPLSQQVIDQFTDAMKAAATVFSQILLYEIEQYHIRKRLEGKGFVPKVDVGELLGRTDHTPSDPQT